MSRETGYLITGVSQASHNSLAISKRQGPARLPPKPTQRWPCPQGATLGHGFLPPLLLSAVALACLRGERKELIHVKSIAEGKEDQNRVLMLSASLNSYTNIWVELWQEIYGHRDKVQLSGAALLYTSLSSPGKHGEHGTVCFNISWSQHVTFWLRSRQLKERSQYCWPLHHSKDKIWMTLKYSALHTRWYFHEEWLPWPQHQLWHTPTEISLVGCLANISQNSDNKAINVF